MPRKGPVAKDPVVATTMAALLNAGITPLVREFGSLGCSGDLAPLSHFFFYIGINTQQVTKRIKRCG